MNKGNLVFGLDPSFSNSGLCIIDIEGRGIYFFSIKPPGKNEDYETSLKRSEYIVKEIVGKFYLLNIGFNICTDDYITVLIYEEPLITSQKASRLGLLSATIYSFFASTLYKELEFIDEAKDFFSEVYIIPPNYVSNLCRPIRKKYSLNKKAASRKVAEDILEYLVTEKSFEVYIHNDKLNKDGLMKKRKLTHDECEAFLMALGYIRDRVDRDFIDKGLLDSLSYKFFDKINIKKVY